MYGSHLCAIPLRRWRQFFPTCRSSRSLICGNWRPQGLSPRVYASIFRLKCSAARVPAEIQLAARPPKIFAHPIRPKPPFFPGIETVCQWCHVFSVAVLIAGNKTSVSGVVVVVTKDDVCLREWYREFDRAPLDVVFGTELHQIYGQWGSTGQASRTPVGAAILVPRRPRDRMGLSGAPWKHARHQR